MFKKITICFLFSIIILLVLLNHFTINECDTFNNTNLSYLNLVLFSSDNDGPYDKMYKETNEYYKSFPNVKTVYYTFSSDISNNYFLDTNKNILYIKGKETYIPGILDKTIKAFEYFKNDYDNYDYIIRTNISTLVNFNLLNEELVKHPVQYSSGLVLTLNWLDPHGGITDESLKGLVYGSGTSIILASNTMKQFLEKKDLIRMDIIDDVAIGLCISRHLPNIKIENIFEKRFIFIPDVNGDSNEINKLILDKNYIFYRNNNKNRNIDPIQIKQIIDFIKN